MQILSVGDSWSAGVWDIVDGKHTVVDSGYKKELYKLGNLTNIWGFNNNQALHNISKYYNNYDIILFFVTDPLRDITDYEKSYSFFVNDFRTAGELLAVHHALLEATIQSAKRFGDKVKLIGGCQTLTHKTDENIIVHSVSELVSNNTYKHPLIWDSGWSGMLNYDRANKDLVKLWADNRELQDAMESDRFKKYFWPDGYHPNGHSNKILGEELVRIITSK